MELAEAAFAQNAHETGERPASVRMAFLIAMPDPAHPHPHPYPAPRSSSFSSGRPSTSSEKGKERDSSSSAFMHRTLDEEPELPYLEFGIADVPVRPPRGHTSACEVASLNVMVKKARLSERMETKGRYRAYGSHDDLFDVLMTVG